MFSTTSFDFEFGVGAASSLQVEPIPVVANIKGVKPKESCRRGGHYLPQKAGSSSSYHQSTVTFGEATRRKSPRTIRRGSALWRPRWRVAHQLVLLLSQLGLGVPCQLGQTDLRH